MLPTVNYKRYEVVLCALKTILASYISPLSCEQQTAAQWRTFLVLHAPRAFTSWFFVYDWHEKYRDCSTTYARLLIGDGQ